MTKTVKSVTPNPSVPERERYSSTFDVRKISRSSTGLCENSTATSGSKRGEFATCGGRDPTRFEEAVLQTNETILSGAADTHTTPDKPINQATSSSAIGSSGGDDAEKPADSTVEEEIPLSEIKRPKTGPNTHVLSVSSTVEYTEGMSGTVSTRKECPVQWSTRKDVQDEGGKCRAAWRAASAVHLTWEVHTTHTVNVKLSKEQQVKLSEEQQLHLKWEVSLKGSVKMSAKATLRHPSKQRLALESRPRRCRLQFT